eukprot:4508345-Amphidinium_carterae.1
MDELDQSMQSVLSVLLVLSPGLTVLLAVNVLCMTRVIIQSEIKKIQSQRIKHVRGHYIRSEHRRSQRRFDNFIFHLISIVRVWWL